ncbi:hypothetical protein [Streptomyces chartreusis]|uniref:hypothetical protein n=1 Tax=Streptomyces chartreusis TaxID=1969 RepID=UPI00123D468F|nr:hypothetical protein [Streptomyces chartreusis]QEV66255.1 hypothetical protein CP983_05965 [Streptomyces chartreusis]GGW99002.1 hypothetical protein GCM10010321_11830 [Streptomyces chartreusis]
MNQPDPTTDQNLRAYRVRAIDLLQRARDIHRETCILARGDVQPPAFRCGMCEVLAEEPAAVPPVDRDALRDRIAATMREHGVVHLGDQVPADEYDCCADAVLPVLPAGRVLYGTADTRAAAERRERYAAALLGPDAAGTLDSAADEMLKAVMTVADAEQAELRRLAGETPADTEAQPSALKRAHVALAAQAGRDQAALVRVREWVTSDVVTARSGFGDGYREAQRDMRDLLNGRPPTEPAAGARQDGAQS